MLNKKDYIYISVLILIGGVSLFNLIDKAEKNQIKKVAFVDVKDVFENFQMKIELQKKLVKETVSHRNYLDSLMFNLQILKNKLESSKKPTNEEINQYNSMQGLYFEHKQEIENRVSKLTAEYDIQIIEQMIQYIKDFGETNDYDFIIGKNEAGNLMYGNIEYDITKEITQFINEKYQGN